MATITETFIRPEIFRPPRKAVYTISDIAESELSEEVQTKLNSGGGGTDAEGPFILGNLSSSNLAGLLSPLQPLDSSDLT